MKQNKKRKTPQKKRKKERKKRLKLQNHARPKDYGDGDETKGKKGKEKKRKYTQKMTPKRRNQS